MPTPVEAVRAARRVVEDGGTLRDVWEALYVDPEHMAIPTVVSPRQFSSTVAVDPGTLVLFNGLGIAVRAGLEAEGTAQAFVTINTEEMPAEHKTEAGNPIMMVHLNNTTLYDDEGTGNRQRSDSCLPDDLMVYVVRPDDPSEDVAVFIREEDAEAFAATYDDPMSPAGDVEHCMVADSVTAAEMICQRLDEDDDGESEPPEFYAPGARVRLRGDMTVHGTVVRVDHKRGHYQHTVEWDGGVDKAPNPWSTSELTFGTLPAPTTSGDQA